MGEENTNHGADEGIVESLTHLKQVSRIKHKVLNHYVPSWALIVGKRQPALYLIDCFAGPGQYEFEGSIVDGSPLIAVKAGKVYAERHPGSSVGVLLVDDDARQISGLKVRIARTQPHPPNLKVAVRLANSHEYVPRAIANLKHRAAPAFVLVDPYGHPLSVPTMQGLLSRPRTELLINLMWFRVNANLSNPSVAHHVTELFGDDDWKAQPFMSLSGTKREKSFLAYFCNRLNANYVLPFRIKFDPEDRVRGSRTKYYLLHASNHVQAVLLMKEVMWPLGDEEGTFEFAGVNQPRLIPKTPNLDDLRSSLLIRFSKRELSFDEIRSATWDLPFIAKHYRLLLKQMRDTGDVVVTPVDSKSGGLKGRDKIRFIQ